MTMAFDAVLKLLFWGALLGVVYSYAIYPALLWLLVKRRRAGNTSTPARPAPRSGPMDVACIVSAFNEERHVVARVQNFLAQAYDGGRLRVYIGSDGSSDNTASLIRGLASDQVVALPFEQNRGKASVLNDLIAAANEPIARRARPTYFNQELAHAADQTQPRAHHAGMANLEAMRIIRGDLDRSAGAIRFTGSSRKHCQ